VGTGAACRSTLVYHLKHRQWWQACDQLTRWVFVNGERNTGLENRRFRERTYCLKGAK
ncbi:glycoside hydrolase family protein, partial [Escherichia coli]|uniref:glycoside hydrolase family protein n=4 Tax=Enterobacteriaceae TaxID=543 RepID=UPI003CE458EC